MDYYDVVATEQNKEDPERERDPSSIDKAADKLETEIEKVYEKAYERISSTNWSSLWGSVKKQAVEAVATAKSSATTSLHIPDEADESEDEKTQGSKNSGSDMLNALTLKARKYIDELDKELDDVENTAAEYFNKVGKDVKSILKDAVSVAPPTGSHDGLDDGEDAGPEILFNVPDDIRQQIYSTRLDAQLNALHTSKEPFVTTTVEEDFVKFKESDFDIDNMTDTIAADLEQFPSLRKLMESLVPETVSYNDFWAKYYYMRKQISEQEAKRKKLVEQASSLNEKISWDDDEDENDEDESEDQSDEHKPADKKKPVSTTDQKKESDMDKDSEHKSKLQPHDPSKVSRPSSSESSYDVVSKSTADEAAQNDDDDDDDWE